MNNSNREWHSMTEVLDEWSKINGEWLPKEEILKREKKRMRKENKYYGKYGDTAYSIMMRHNKKLFDSLILEMQLDSYIEDIEKSAKDFYDIYMQQFEEHIAKYDDYSRRCYRNMEESTVKEIIMKEYIEPWVFAEPDKLD